MQPFPHPDDQPVVSENEARFIAWFSHGVEQGWISPPSCAPHDGIPMNEIEEEEYEEGYDPCLFIVRVWGPDGERPEPRPWDNAHLN